MRRRPPVPEEFVPSTTRAVAWGALFFSLLAFLISLATLFLTWRDGQLVKNSRLLLDGLDKTVVNWSASRGKPSGASDASDAALKAEQAGNAENPVASVRWEKIREKVEQLETMVDSGDSRARFYLDNLVEELGPLREYTSDTTSQWVGATVDKLKVTREQIRENAPEALRNLKTLSESLRRQSTGEDAMADDSLDAGAQDDLLDFDLDLDGEHP